MMLTNEIVHYMQQWNYIKIRQKEIKMKEVERELWMRIQSGGDDTKEEHGKYR